MIERDSVPANMGGLRRFVSRIGACGKCMRQSFQAAFLAVCACAPAWLAGSLIGSATPALVVGCAAAALTALWIVHVLVFGARVALKATARDGAPGSQPLAGLAARSSKREFLSIFAKAVGAVTIATVVPSRLALAYGNCYDANSFPCITTFCVPAGSQNACCPAAYRYLNHCDCRCYQSSSDFSCGSYSFCH